MFKLNKEKVPSNITLKIRERFNKDHKKTTTDKVSKSFVSLLEEIASKLQEQAEKINFLNITADSAIISGKNIGYININWDKESKIQRQTLEEMVLPIVLSQNQAKGTLAIEVTLLDR